MTIKIEGDEKHIKIDWGPVVNSDDVVEKVIISIYDYTQIDALAQKLKDEEDLHKQDLNIMLKVIKISRRKAKNAIEEIKSNMDSIQALDHTKESYKKDLFGLLHTIKGISRIVGFTEIAHEAHSIEDDLSQQLRDSDIKVLTQIAKKIELLKQHIDGYHHVIVDILGNEDENDSSFTALTGVVHNHLESINNYLTGHKITINAIKCVDHIVNWHPDTLSNLSAIIMHAFNNSADHGYVLPRNEEKLQDMYPSQSLPKSSMIAFKS